MYNFHTKRMVRPGSRISKILMIMRLTTLILITTMLQVSANTFGQKISLSERNAPIEKVLDKIRQQSGFDFMLPSADLKNAKPISIVVKNANLNSVLKQVFDNQPFDYAVLGKSVVVSRKELSVIDKISALFSDQVVNGQVGNEKGTVMPGVTVRLKGSAMKPVTTDSEGRFTMRVPDKAVLVFSYVGYVTQEIIARPNMNVIMQLSLTDLNEVSISTGYVSRKTGELTGSVQRITGDELRKGLTTSDPVSLLKGRVAGLYIAEQGAGDPTNAGGQIFVRGQSSIAGVGVDQFNEIVMPSLNYGPLLVLDGVIMANQNLKDLVTPQEIEDIVILKDAAATAIYGSRAAGGVLVVTTKRGTTGKTRISGEIKYGVNKPNQGTFRYLNGQELYDLQTEYYTQDYNINAGLKTTYPTLQNYLDFRLPAIADVANSYDWSKWAFSSDHTKEATISASGGSENTKYYVGAGYYDEQSVGVSNGLKRKNVRMNLDSKLTDRLTATLSVNAIINNGNRDTRSANGTLYTLVPWANPYDANGALRPSLTYKLNGTTRTTDNPLYNEQFEFFTVNSQLLFGSARLSYRIFDWLDLSSTNSGSLNYNQSRRYYDARSYSSYANASSTKGALLTNGGQVSSYLTSNQLSAKKRFGDHSLSALAAMEFGKTVTENMTVNVNNIKPGYPFISVATGIGTNTTGATNTKLRNIEGGQNDRAQYSLFGEVGYTYKDKISLSGSIRSDASSSFGPEERYGTFFSGGAAWILSQEDFIKNSAAITNLKLRANYGTSGSQLGDNFLNSTLYRPGNAYAGQSAARVVSVGNPNLRWEVTKTFSAGVDFELFRRINATVDFYSRRSEDLLQKVDLNYLAGFGSQWQNAATVNNSGVEILINSQNIVGKKFNWSTSFNISHNKNRIVSLPKDSLSQGFGGQFYLYKGEDINTLKAVKYAGVDPDNGKPRFEKLLFNAQGERIGVEYVDDINLVNARLDQRQNQTIGTFQPKFYGGITNNFSYGPLSLNVLVTFATDFILNDGYAGDFQGRNLGSGNQIAFREQDVIWTTPGQTNATHPLLYYNATSTFRGSDKYFHNASNIALRTVRLSYELPPSLLKKLNIGNCIFYISGDNLYTLYSKDIVSVSSEGPSVGQAQSFGGSAGTLGIPRRYIFGLQLTF